MLSILEPAEIHLETNLWSVCDLSKNSRKPFQPEIQSQDLSFGA